MVAPTVSQIKVSFKGFGDSSGAALGNTGNTTAPQQLYILMVTASVSGGHHEPCITKERSSALGITRLVSRVDNAGASHAFGQEPWNVRFAASSGSRAVMRAQSTKGRHQQ